jgi:hypothetical protein
VSFSLSKAQVAKLEGLKEQLDQGFNYLQRICLEREQAISKADAEVARAADAYNSMLREAEAFAQDIAETARDAFDEKSERWQESSRGQAALSFTEEWENVNLEEVDDEGTIRPDQPISGHGCLARVPVEAEE